MNSIATRVTGARSRDRLKPATATFEVIAGIAARTPSVAVTVSTTERSIPVVILDLLEQTP
jgi:hypothetical protein